MDDIFSKIRTATQNDVIQWDDGRFGYIDGKCVLKITKLPDKDEWVVHTVDEGGSYTHIGVLSSFYVDYVANIERQATTKRQQAIAELEQLLS